jgi:cytidylate kinase
VVKKINIAIDGFSSCGKSTLAKSLAKILGYTYIDTGAMYRAVTLYAMQQNHFENNVLNAEKLISELDNIHIDFVNQDGKNLTRLNGVIIEDKIRSMEVSDKVSPVSKIKAVRTLLRTLQQDMARQKGVVMDGRDIGSAVLPDAPLKIFMTADKKVRALRRYRELQNNGVDASLEKVMENIEKRDLMDTQRKEDPLIQVPDAILLDNTELDPGTQLSLVKSWVDKIIQEA